MLSVLERLLQWAGGKDRWGKASGRKTLSKMTLMLKGDDRPREGKVVMSDVSEQR